MSERGTDKQQSEQHELSRVYAELARERVPEELDRKILDLAVRRKTRRLSEWSKPIAIAATIAICFALLPELVERTRLSPAGNRGGDSAAAPEALRSSLPETAEQQLVPAEKARFPRGSMATQPGESSAEHAAMPGLTNEAQADDTNPDASTSLCPAASRESPDTWWQCILALREAARDIEANAEIELLSAAFPGFAPPE